MTAADGPARPYLPILDAVRVAAVSGVVAIHVIGGAVEQGTGGWALAALDMALVAAVPAFFMMSGALALSPSAMRDGARGFWRRRAGRLVPAVIAWSAFYLLAIRWGVSGVPLTGDHLLYALVTGRTYTHLYFLWALLGLTAIAPALWELIRADQGRRAWILGIAACTWTALVTSLPDLTGGRFVAIGIGTLTYPLVYGGYYLVGRAALVAPVRRAWAARAILIWALCTALLSVLYVTDADSGTGVLAALAPSYVSPVTMLGSIALFAAIIALGSAWRVGERGRARLRQLGEAIFGIYLIHFAVLVILRQIPWFGEQSLLSLPVSWAIVLVVSGLLALAMARVPGLRRIV